MVEKYARKNIYKTYNPGEKVFVRIRKKEENSQRHKVLAGTVEKRYQDHTCLVKYKLLNSDDSIKPKFRIEDMSDFPKDKNVNAKKTKRTRKGKLIKSVCVYLRSEMIW